MKILDELSYAEKLLKNGFTKPYFTGELIILAKYFRYIGKTNLEEELISYCKKFIPEFIESIYICKILYAIKLSSKNSLRVPVFVPITKNELEKIKAIKNYRYEKVLFTMLALGKYFKLTNTGSKNKSNIYYINFPNCAIFRMAHTSQKKNENIMHFLYRNGFIDNDRVHDAYYLKFTDADDNSEIDYYITDINNVIQFFPPHCDICGEPLKKKGNRQSMCYECWKEHRKLSERELSKQRMRKYRRKMLRN